MGPPGRQSPRQSLENACKGRHHPAVPERGEDVKLPKGRAPIVAIGLLIAFLLLIAMVDVFGYHLP